MSYVFIGGIPASGKSYLAEKLFRQTGALHVDIDKLKGGMAENPKLTSWVNFFWNQDEEKYLKETSCDKHWQNLVKQSEAFWSTILRKVEEVKSSNSSAIFEGVNILPHLAARDFDFPGIYLLGKSFEEIFERNTKNPRWGKTKELQRKEAELFFYCGRLKYKEEAEKYGFPVFSDFKEAEKEVLNLLA